MADSAEDVSRNLTLGWSPASRLDDTYDLYLDTDYPPEQRIAEGISETWWNLNNLAPGTRYYIGLRAHNQNGSSPLEIVTFATGGSLEYCEIGPPGAAIIESVAINTLDYAYAEELAGKALPQEPPYTTTLRRGKTYPVQCGRWSNTADLKSYSIEVYIDLNQDGDFADADEIYSEPLTLTSSQRLGTKNIYVPESALLGTTKMRVEYKDIAALSDPAYTPCLSGASTAISGLEKGTYQSFITDASGCEVQTDLIAVTRPPGLKVEEVVGHIQCSGQNTGSVALEITGGIAPYSIAWLKNGNTISETGAALSGLEIGTYQTFITDAAGCEVQTSHIAVTGPPEWRIEETVEQIQMLRSKYRVHSPGSNRGHTFLYNFLGKRWPCFFRSRHYPRRPGERDLPGLHYRRRGL